MDITREQLVAIMPFAKHRATRWLKPINRAMAEFNIYSPIRQAMFLANIAHESGELLYTKEIASGEAYDTGRLAKKLGNTPEEDGDGQRYKGRGPIQITGRYNYEVCGKALGLDLIAHPELLEDPIHGARASAWFWESHGLNALAELMDFQGVCGVINTGSRNTPANRIRGYDDRLRYYTRARKALGD